MKYTLSDRLLKIASYTFGLNSIADIGSDHSYLAKYLLENKIISYAMCVEAVFSPYQKSLNNLKQLISENKADVLLSWGIDNVPCDKIEGIIISGIGGNLTLDILNKDISKTKKFKKIILQPQNAQAEVRKFLHKNNLEIINEAIVYENNKFYEIICASPSQRVVIREEIFYEIPLLCVLNKSPFTVEFIKYKQQKLYNIINSCLKKNTELSNEKINKSKKKISDLEEILKCL